MSGSSAGIVFLRLAKVCFPILNLYSASSSIATSVSYQATEGTVVAWKGVIVGFNTKEFIEFLLKEFENMDTKLHILREVAPQEIIYDNTYVWFDIDFHPDPVGVINIGMVRDMSRSHSGDKLDKFLSIYYSVEDKMWSYSVRTQNNEISYANSTKCDSFVDLIKNCLTEARLIKK